MLGPRPPLSETNKHLQDGHLSVAGHFSFTYFIKLRAFLAGCFIHPHQSASLFIYTMSFQCGNRNDEGLAIHGFKCCFPSQSPEAGIRLDRLLAPTATWNKM